MLIKALQSIVIRDAETGELTSIGYGLTAEVEDSVGNALIADGIAEKVEASGGVEITSFTAFPFVNARPSVTLMGYHYVEADQVGKIEEFSISSSKGTEIPLIGDCCQFWIKKDANYKLNIREYDVADGVTPPSIVEEGFAYYLRVYKGTKTVTICYVDK